MSPFVVLGGLQVDVFHFTVFSVEISASRQCRP